MQCREMKRPGFILSLAAGLLGCLNGYAQPGAPAPYGAIPSARQLQWQEMEMYCLIHFTPTTFQNSEWGYGNAAPSVMNPGDFDALKIVRAAASAGCKGVIFVTKHHDGFAMWPTRTSPYNISRSPWKKGKGDMVKEFELAARHEGLKFGIYCSPWDRNNPDYGTPAYLTDYRNQLKELYSRYGSLFMSWHDGANGGDGYYEGRKERRVVDPAVYYDWYHTWEITRRLQPDAVLFSDVGPDVRWVGNEAGFAPETSWATVSLKGTKGKVPMPGAMDEANLGSGTRNGEKWMPFEADVPLRKGWFYHPAEDSMVKSPSQLFEIYCQTVGRGGCLDLGLSPTPLGQLHPGDAAILKAFGEMLHRTFAVNLAGKAQIKVSDQRAGSTPGQFGPGNLTDEDRYSCWATADDVHQATAELSFKQPVTFSLIRLRENIRLGQRIDSVALEVFNGKAWLPAAKATSIGANRIIRLPHRVSADRVRLKIWAPVSIALSEIGLYTDPEQPV